VARTGLQRRGRLAAAGNSGSRWEVDGAGLPCRRNWRPPAPLAPQKGTGARPITWRTAAPVCGTPNASSASAKFRGLISAAVSAQLLRRHQLREFLGFAQLGEHAVLHDLLPVVESLIQRPGQILDRLLLHPGLGK